MATAVSAFSSKSTAKRTSSLRQITSKHSAKTLQCRSLLQNRHTSNAKKFRQALNEGKPEKIVEKMIVGRIEKFYKENCLLDQEFIKDSDKTVQQVVTEAIAKIGEKIDIRRYTRYELGEGLEKRNDDFVSEVMAQAK